MCKQLFSGEKNSGHIKCRYKIIDKLISIKVLWKSFHPNTSIKNKLQTSYIILSCYHFMLYLWIGQSFVNLLSEVFGQSFAMTSNIEPVTWITWWCTFVIKPITLANLMTLLKDRSFVIPLQLSYYWLIWWHTEGGYLLDFCY